MLCVALVGVALVFCSLKGIFKNKNKVDFFKKIISDVEITHPSAKIFLKKYFYSLDINADDKNIQIDKIIYVGTFVKHDNQKEPLEGVIKVRNVNGEASIALCSYNELKNWAYKTPFWDWFAWILIAFSTIIEIVIFLIESNNNST